MYWFFIREVTIVNGMLEFDKFTEVSEGYVVPQESLVVTICIASYHMEIHLIESITLQW